MKLWGYFVDESFSVKCVFEDLLRLCVYLTDLLYTNFTGGVQNRTLSCNVMISYAVKRDKGSQRLYVEILLIVSI